MEKYLKYILISIAVAALTGAAVYFHDTNAGICFRSREHTFCTAGFIQEPLRNDDCRFEHSVASGSSTDWDRQLIYMHVSSSPSQLCRWVSTDLGLNDESDCSTAGERSLTLEYAKDKVHYVCIKESYGVQCLDLYDITER